MLPTAQRPLPATAPSDRSQRPLPATAPSDRSQRPLPATAPSDRSQRPLPAPTRSLRQAEDEIDDIQQEIAVMAQCNSRYVTRYFASYVEGTKLWIVMEYVGGGSILDIMDNGPVSAASSTHAATRPPAPYPLSRPSEDPRRRPSAQLALMRITSNAIRTHAHPIEQPPPTDAPAPNACR